MIWSISTGKTFKQCQRQWYFKNCVANAVAKDPLRRRAYLLSKLQSISAWRGGIVDSIISNVIVPACNSKRKITLNDAKRAATELFNKQLNYARKHPLAEPGLSPSKLGDEFTVFRCMEYGGEISEDEITTAKAEIDRALENLFSMLNIRTQLKSADYLISQRPLTFSHSGETVRAVPDLIAFYREQPPLIVDWKVHVFGVSQAWLQLGTYALALARGSVHRDFPYQFNHWKETDIRLLEVQLLTKQIRSYSLTQPHIDAIDDYIAESIYDISLALGEVKKPSLVPTDFPAATLPETCQRCAYQSLCWEVVS